jgi:hypothetical protein
MAERVLLASWVNPLCPTLRADLRTKSPEAVGQKFLGLHTPIYVWVTQPEGGSRQGPSPFWLRLSITHRITPLQGGCWMGHPPPPLRSRGSNPSDLGLTRVCDVTRQSDLVFSFGPGAMALLKASPQR